MKNVYRMERDRSLYTIAEGSNESDSESEYSVSMPAHSMVHSSSSSSLQVDAILKDLEKVTGELEACLKLLTDMKRSKELEFSSSSSRTNNSFEDDSDQTDCFLADRNRHVENSKC